MNKPGYIIAKNSLAKEFFTSASAYDRPEWKQMNEATIYATAELADAAVKKLLRNGAYQARLVPLSELNLSMSPIAPMGIHNPQAQSQGLPPADELGDEVEEPGMEAGTLDGEEGSDDGMESSEHEDVCPECEHVPCTCEHSDEDDLGDEGSSDEFGDEDIGDDELELDLNGGPDENEQEADPRFDARRLGMAQLSPMGGPRMESATMPARPVSDAQPTPTNTPAEKIDVLKFKDPAQVSGDENEEASPNEDKIKIPANVMSELKATIADFDKQAEFSKTSDEARSSFCMTAADAMKTIQADLEKGTVEGVKMAQVHLSSYMSPIVNHVPACVIKFIASGGAKPSLKDLFNAKREEKN